MLVLSKWICLSQDRMEDRQTCLTHKQLFKNRLLCQIVVEERTWVSGVFPQIKFPCVCAQVEAGALLQGASSATHQRARGLDPHSIPSGAGARGRTGLSCIISHSVWEKLVLSHKARAESSLQKLFMKGINEWAEIQLILNNTLPTAWVRLYPEFFQR